MRDSENGSVLLEALVSTAIVAAVLAAIGLGFAVAAWHRGRARSASA